jgi:Na+/H+ antiporter NhaD/arsenite permease-like protein
MSLASNLAIPIIVLTFIGVAAGEFPGLKMNRATIALVAAVLLVILQIISPSAALKAIDINTLLLLFAMMIINAHLRIAGFFDWVGQFVGQRARSPRILLAWILVSAGFLSALFLNDTIALVFAPLVLDVTRSLKRNPVPYLLGLAASVNVGSVATITGNPQNILIGSSSHISFIMFTSRLGPVALIGLAIVWVILTRLYKTEFDQSWQNDAPQIHHDGIDKVLLRKSLILSGIMVMAFLAGLSMPLAAIAIAAALLISRRVQPENVFEHVDWSLLVFFSGLFIVTGALEKTYVVNMIFAFVKPIANSGIGMLAVVTAILSNLISNVPAVLLFRSAIPQLAHPAQAWLTLAMASTLAGNLTLLGSVANLIVAEAARSQGVKISFREYLRVGLPITAATILAGIIWLSIFA